MKYIVEGQMSLFDLDTWSGKMSAEHSAVTAEKTSEPSLKKLRGWSAKMPLFLDLRKANGHMPDVSWGMDGASLGAPMTLNFGESPNEDAESRLSQILEATPHPKYCLSAKACQGILRRADARGKVLPKILRDALERQSVSKNEPENLGGGKGILIQYEHTGALNQQCGQSVCSAIGFNRERGVATMNETMPTMQAAAGESGNNKPMVCYPISTMNATRGGEQDEPQFTISSSSEEVSGVLRARDYKDPQIVCLNDQCGQQMDVSDGQGWEESTVNDTLNCHDNSETRTPTLVVGVDTYNLATTGNVGRTLTAAGGGINEHTPVVIENHPADSRVKVCKNGVVQTLSSRMGTGGNNTPMVLEPMLLESNQNHATIQTDGVSTSLPASMGIGGGYVPMVVNEPMLLENTQDHGTVNTSGRCTTLTARMGTGGNNVPMVKKTADSIVRRLTPLECERLQGYPDGWTDIGDWVDSSGKKHKGDSDSPRYKALGNSIALPFWQWMAGCMAEHLPENATMASLFDGIGGFPLVYSRVGVKPIWASEIEEFPIAVTKLRFPEEGEDHGTESNT